MTWLNWLMIGFSLVVALTLADGLRHGELFVPLAHVLHSEVRRRTHPVQFWVVFGSWALVLCACLWAALRW